MSALDAFREELAHIVDDVKERFGHLVSWERFERGAATVEELEEELTKLGLPLGPLEALTEALLEVARQIHGHVKDSAEEAAKLSQDELAERIAELTAQLDPPKEPAPKGKTPPPKKD